MQSYAALMNEVAELREEAECDRISIVRSSEPWNPVAAVILHSAVLPISMRPQVADLRILIPNLYGLAVSAGVFMVSVPLMEFVDGRLSLVPFCVPTEQTTLQKQRPYYVDVRENYAVLLRSYSLCVTPTVLPDRFKHVRLWQLLSFLLEYLDSPALTVRAELEEQYERLDYAGPSLFLLLCIAHSHAGLQEYQAALNALEYASYLYPDDSSAKRKAEHIRSMM